MKKIAIITIIDFKNYGNRLQNYATTRIFEKIGYRAETINVIENDRVFIYNLRLIKRFIWDFLGIRKSSDKIPFRRFTKKHINNKITTIDYVYSEQFQKRYDYVALGGDQIWGPYMQTYGRLGYRFGDMLPPDRRITMCPSFGGTKIADEDKGYFKKYLSELKNISIREESGAKLIKEITGKDATVVVDPVMALTVDEWKKVFNTKKYSKDDYVLCCFLGGEDDFIKTKVNEIANGKEVKKVCSDTKESNEGPSGFLSLIYNAKAICTDSFHCAAFSVLFKKPLIVFDRINIDKSQNTRLLNLLNKFNLDLRHIDKLKETEYYNCNYNTTDSILEKERKIFYDFLEMHLGENEHEN